MLCPADVPFLPGPWRRSFPLPSGLPCPPGRLCCITAHACKGGGGLHAPGAGDLGLALDTGQEAPLCAEQP